MSKVVENAQKVSHPPVLISDSNFRLTRLGMPLFRTKFRIIVSYRF